MHSLLSGELSIIAEMIMCARRPMLSMSSVLSRNNRWPTIAKMLFLYISFVDIPCEHRTPNTNSFIFVRNEGRANRNRRIFTHSEW